MRDASASGRDPAQRLGRRAGMLVAVAGACLLAAPAAAQRIEHSVAVFAALDKVTARISKLEVKLGETVRFGSLKITPRSCYARDPRDTPKTTTFVEVEEVLLDGKEKRLFAGWMFAESPGLNAVEHPVFDVWLTGCSEPQRPAAAAPPKGPAATAQGKQPPAPPPADTESPRRRPRR